MSGPFAAHLLMSKPVQLLVDDRHQLIPRLQITIAPGNEQLGHILWRARHPRSTPYKAEIGKAIANYTLSAASRPHFLTQVKRKPSRREGFPPRLSRYSVKNSTGTAAQKDSDSTFGSRTKGFGHVVQPPNPKEGFSVKQASLVSGREFTIDLMSTHRLR